MLGCKVRVLHSSGALEYPHGIATDATHVYWVALQNHGSLSAYDGRGEGTIRRVEKRPPHRVEEVVTAKQDAKEIVLTKTHVYWSAFRAPEERNAPEIRRVPIGCASCPIETVTTLSGGQVGRLVALDDDTLVAATESGVFLVSTDGQRIVQVKNEYRHAGLTRNQHGVYLSSLLKSSEVLRVDRGGVERFATLPPSDEPERFGANILAGSCGSLWAFMKGGRLVGAPTDSDGGFTKEHPLDPDVDWWDAVADSKYVYLGAANLTARLVAVDRESGTATTLADSVTAWRLAVDDDGLYWGHHGYHGDGAGAGSIHMMVKNGD